MSKIIAGHLINRRLDRPTGTTIKCSEYARILSSKIKVNLFAAANNSILKDKVQYSLVRRIFIPEYWSDRAFSGHKTVFSTFLSYTSGYRNILKVKSDLWHCHATTTSEIAYLFREFIQIPMIYDVHGIVDPRDKRSRHREKILFRDFEGIIVESDRTKDYILSQNKNVNPEKIFSVSECVDLDSLEANIDTARQQEIIDKYDLKGEKIFMYGGGITEGVQDSMCLFKTLKRINKHYSNSLDKIKLVIITRRESIDTSFMKKINDYINVNNLKNILWLDPVPYTELYNYYRIADVIICPARKAPKGAIATSTLEPLTKIFVSMGSSIPTVCANLLGNRDLVSNGINGIMVDPGNSDAYASAIINLFDNEDVATVIGTAGRKKILKDHNPELICNELLTAYNKVLCL